ncbi:Protein of unknown function [Pyronema omphalodes CBS 100304]|uniref:Uncharacterized protein n=1 Tax=Pyronema omphalodes (strain CBS 100304) TaxID=1076935 RepID=U4LKB5_PYROM|nr:Protein of unknown function [Pyronema omphalodes CBS 100304]
MWFDSLKGIGTLLLMFDATYQDSHMGSE